MVTASDWKVRGCIWYGGRFVLTRGCLYQICLPGVYDTVCACIWYEDWSCLYGRMYLRSWADVFDIVIGLIWWLFVFIVVAGCIWYGSWTYLISLAIVSNMVSGWVRYRWRLYVIWLAVYLIRWLLLFNIFRLFSSGSTSCSLCLCVRACVFSVVKTPKMPVL